MCLVYLVLFIAGFAFWPLWILVLSFAFSGKDAGPVQGLLLLGFIVSTVAYVVK